MSWLGGLMEALLPVALLLHLLLSGKCLSATTGYCELESSSDYNVKGHCRFTPLSNSSVRITGYIEGLTPGGKHGFHIHEHGDLSNNCKSCGGHYNPYNRDHGAPDSDDRHVGDLGNIVSDSSGVATVDFIDTVISVGDTPDRPPQTDILGRALVVHAGEDDLGRGGNPESLVTGNAGARMACCVVTPGAGARAVTTSASHSPWLLMAVVTLVLLTTR